MKKNQYFKLRCVFWYTIKVLVYFFSLIGAMFANIYTQPITLRNDCVRIAVLENVRDHVSLLHIEI